MRQQGFGLIQLLVGLAIAAVAAQLAVPGVGQLIDGQRRAEAARQLASAIRLARTEAIMRNRVVRVEAIDDNWSHGWRMTVESQTVEGNLLLAERASSATVPIVGNQRAIRFNGMGTPQRPGGAFFATTLHVCDTQHAVSHYRVILAKTGRSKTDSGPINEPLCR